MTRFARASGSKSSNQRIPEDSTPWFLLQQQVTKEKSDADQEQTTDWKSMLDTEKKVELNKNSVWCDFEVEKPKSNVNGAVNKPNKKSKEGHGKSKRKSTEESLLNNDTSIMKSKKKARLNSEEDSAILTNMKSDSKYKGSDLKFIKTKLNLPKKPSFEVKEMENGIGLEDQRDILDSSPPKKKKYGRSNIEGYSKSSTITDDGITRDENGTFSDPNTEKCMSGNDSSEFEKSEANRDKWKDSSLNIKSKTDFLQKDSGNKTNHNYSKRNNSITWKKGNKKESSQPFNRRKYDEGDVKLEINGLEIWVTRLDGFYIKKEDAERIRQLEKDLLSRGVSKQEVRAVVKKERRNAEKALARQKKKVCFHCRKGGHSLSSCPKLEENGAQGIGSGICYKCGSTEHTHFQCKVSSGDSYKFATCFVCKQEGHISRQCPDNPRGMYPVGGGCRLCGDVTHFRRECPTLQAKSNKVTVGLIGEDVETLGDQPDKPPNSKQFNKGRKNKLIKFS